LTFQQHQEGDSPRLQQPPVMAVSSISWDEITQKSGRQWNKKLYSSLPFIAFQVQESTVCLKNIRQLMHVSYEYVRYSAPAKSAANVAKRILPE
jgi:hypothetical protein